jgi:hypothetical protein
MDVFCLIQFRQIPCWKRLEWQCAAIEGASSSPTLPVCPSGQRGLQRSLMCATKKHAVGFRAFCVKLRLRVLLIPGHVLATDVDHSGVQDIASVK